MELSFLILIKDLSPNAYEVEKVVDPTGAGDCFIGGITGYLISIKKSHLILLNLQLIMEHQ